MKKFIKLNKLNKADKVAVLSPSSGLPGLFPWVQDLGLKRLEEDFGLVAKEYPTTRQMGSSLKDRATDIMAAFADPEIKAVIASIGGDDQIKLIKYLDPKVFLDNPKPFYGFSDNTHLHNFLWNLGIPSYYGGGIMNQYAMQNKMDDITVNSLKASLFEDQPYEVEVAEQYNDIGLDWADKSSLDKTRVLEPNDGLIWDGDQDASGILWGGCVESLIAQVATNIYLPSSDDLDGAVLYLETAEDIPEHWVIEYLLTGFGERGWLKNLQGVLVGRPKAWEFNKQLTADQKAEYRKQQQATVLKTVRQYNPTCPVVQNVDFGHTDPQVVVPSGRRVDIKSKHKKLIFEY